MHQRSRNTRPYCWLVQIGFILFASACSSDSSNATAPKHTFSLVDSQGTPFTKGAISATGTTTIDDTMLNVSVTIKNDSTAPVSFANGPCGLQFALYPTGTQTTTPAWAYIGICQSLQDIMVNPDQSRTVTGGVYFADSMESIGKVPAGTYNVVASLGGIGSTGISVDAGTVNIGN